MINHTGLLLILIKSISILYNGMIENLLYVIVGFAATYLSLEVAWHFSVCKIKDDSNIIKPCIFKEIKTLLTTSPSQTRGGRIY